MIKGAVSLNTLAKLAGATKPGNRVAISANSKRIAAHRMVSRTGISRISIGYASSIAAVLVMPAACLTRVSGVSSSPANSASIHLAMTTFCWLPPDRLPTS